MHCVQQSRCQTPSPKGEGESGTVALSAICSLCNLNVIGMYDNGEGGGGGGGGGDICIHVQALQPN